tara:strand:- start:5001 stop:5492 length:492 start_codon:yes stop_codon:yes gene_type:complete
MSKKFVPKETYRERTEEDIAQFHHLLLNISITGFRIGKAYEADPEGNQDLLNAWGHLVNMHHAECELALLGTNEQLGEEDASISRPLLEAKRDEHKAALKILQEKHEQTLLEENGIECANPLCNERFVPDRRRKYHSKKCQKRAATNRYAQKKKAKQKGMGGV